MKTAMILAAGRGERMKPLTDKLPKALCVVKGKTLIEHHLDNLARAGFSKVIINHAHLGGHIRRALKSGKDWGLELSFAAEPPGGLETGGGILNALPLLGDKPFITVNADIYTSFDFASLKAPEESCVHLVLGSNPLHNSSGDFGISSSGLLTNDKVYTFLGIASYHPSVFANSKPGRYSVTPMLRYLADKQLATAELFSGFWADIGTVERLQAVNL